ncbi:hypothetical protein FLT15_23770 [Paenibacillus thiaminolyticus]|uniref:hypothetical protein n=1 Tax=Paenibacillus thiaminolyticus TaxID=49283 RepID=UPI0013F60B00|nr:hypothetical protein [Paenibacillus thiaminolyticus]NGP61254.1 hypothetical protein [Paenibacillus thiaminolyticus]
MLIVSMAVFRACRPCSAARVPVVLIVRHGRSWGMAAMQRRGSAGEGSSHAREQD